MLRLFVACGAFSKPTDIFGTVAGLLPVQDPRRSRAERGMLEPVAKIQNEMRVRGIAIDWIRAVRWVQLKGILHVYIGSY